jgi:UDP:flavonoid glycosyltransferase YjiC (YdhE family)
LWRDPDGPVLAYTSPARGHLYPLTPILDELRRRGHQVALRTLSSQIDTMRARGFDANPVDPRVEAIPHDDWKGSNQRDALNRAVRVFGARAAIEADDVRRAIADERPDAVLVDINCWGARRVSRFGAGRGRCSVPIRYRCPRATLHRTVRASHPREAHWVGCGTG